ncbi:MAG: hypothetical protein JWM11_1206, partial [Planctomycetaceae bacterium]|nr:hypothetical protein [Planctomycetaceae bacterium]
MVFPLLLQFIEQLLLQTVLEQKSGLRSRL